MINNSNKDNIQKVLSGFLGKNIEISAENAEKINNIINSLGEEEIKKITQLATSGQLQKIVDKKIAKNEQKR